MFTLLHVKFLNSLLFLDKDIDEQLHVLTPALWLRSLKFNEESILNLQFKQKVKVLSCADRHFIFANKAI